MDIKAGDIVNVRQRLWRVDSTAAARELFKATSMAEVHGSRPFSILSKNVREASIPVPSVDKIGYASSNKFLMQSFRYSILHGSAPLLSLQRNCVLPTNYQLVPVVMAHIENNC
jgi:hypothetical protein